MAELAGPAVHAVENLVPHDDGAADPLVYRKEHGAFHFIHVPDFGEPGEVCLVVCQHGVGYVFCDGPQRQIAHLQGRAVLQQIFFSVEQTRQRDADAQQQAPVDSAPCEKGLQIIGELFIVRVVVLKMLPNDFIVQDVFAEVDQDETEMILRDFDSDGKISVVGQRIDHRLPPAGGF